MYDSEKVWTTLQRSTRVGGLWNQMPETSTSVAPLEGKTTVDEKMFFEPERLSYQAAATIAAAIARAVQTKVKDKIVVIAGTQLLTDFANLQAVYATLESLSRDYLNVVQLGHEFARRRSQPVAERRVADVSEEAFSAALIGAIAPATALVNAALGLVSFFREDVEYRGSKTVVDTLAFEITLASQLMEGGAKEVIVPDLRVDSSPSTNGNSLSNRLGRVQTAKTEAWALLAPMISELVQLEAELEKAGRDMNQPEFDRISALVSDLRRDMQPISEPLARADQRLSDIQNQWNCRDGSTGLAELARLLRAESIVLTKPTYLHAKVVSSGGHYRISRSLLRSIFVGDGLSFAGGATVRWALLEESGSVVKGGILVERSTGSFQNSLGRNKLGAEHSRSSPQYHRSALPMKRERTQ